MKYTIDEIMELTPREGYFFFERIQKEKINETALRMTLAGHDGDRWRQQLEQATGRADDVSENDGPKVILDDETKALIRQDQAREALRQIELAKKRALANA